MRSLRALKASVVVPSAGLCVLLAAGGGVMAMVEGVDYIAGLTLAFSVISTTGFPPGPQTAGGWIIAMVLFAAAAVCWLTLLAAAVALAVRNAGGSDSLPRVGLGLNGVRRSLRN